MESQKFTLPKSFAEKWIKALRSGEYTQTTDTLYRPKICGYCCLGVAAHIQGISNDDLSDNGELGELWDDKDWDELEWEINMNEFGIPKQIIRGDLKSILINMNDTERNSFNEIANWLEENVEFI